MSTIIMNKCWPLKMTPTQKSVLISLADNASDEGVCWPSIKTICKRTCLSERSVQRAINWLEEQGVLIRDLRYKRSTVYEFDLNKLDNFNPVTVSPDMLTGDTLTPSAPSECRSNPVTVTPRTVIEPSIEPSLKNNKRGTRLPDDFVMPDEWVSIGKEIRPDLADQQVVKIANSFIDYWQASSSKTAIKRNWLAAWRYWLRNQKLKQPDDITNLKPRQPAIDVSSTGWIDDMENLL